MSNRRFRIMIYPPGFHEAGHPGVGAVRPDCFHSHWLVEERSGEDLSWFDLHATHSLD
jgi:hypothetical protein